MSTHTAKTTRIARTVAIAIGVAAVSVGAFSAQAAEALVGTQPANTVVDYSDLDLSRDADAKLLYARLQKASERVCGRSKDLRNLSLVRLKEECYQDSLARAVDSVGHAAVKAVFAADERIRVAARASKAAAST